MTSLLAVLLACGSPASSGEPEPQPEPTPAATVTIQVGTQCVEPAEGEPADAAAVKAKLTAAGIQVSAMEAMATCEACNTCPRMAFLITTDASEEEVQAAIGAAPEAPPTKVKVAVGRKCQDPADGAPTDETSVLAALEAAGIEVASHETMIVCQSCGCPELAMMVEVASGDAVPVKELSQPWVPPREKNDLKGSLP